MRIGTGPRRKPPVRPQEPHCLLGHDDRGQLLLLAGVILTLAFLVTSLTLLQFRSIERTNALDSLLNLIDERHDVPARLGEALERHTGPTGSAVQFKNTEFPTIAAAGRRELASYGNEGSRLLAAEVDTSLHNGTASRAWSTSRDYRFTGTYEGEKRRHHLAKSPPRHPTTHQRVHDGDPPDGSRREHDGEH